MDLEELCDWVEEEEEVERVVSLFNQGESFSSVAELVANVKAGYGWDLAEACRRAIDGKSFDRDMGTIMMVNYIRRSLRDGAAPEAVIAQVEVGDFLADDDNMRPCLEGDNLLFLLRDEVFGDDEEGDDAANVDGGGGKNVPSGWVGAAEDTPAAHAAPAASSSSGSSDKNGSSEEVEQLRAQLAQALALVDNLVNEPDRGKVHAIADDEQGNGNGKAGPRQDDYYFESYAGISIHETMLRDSARTTSYAKAMLDNADYFHGKVVLDVGCGTGILSMIAAKAGARKVVGVDESSILDYTRKIVATNGLSDVITLVQGRIEETPLPLVEDEVDIVVSEWMGYGLFYENMFPSVIFARDTLMKDSGVVLPSRATLFMEALSVPGEEDRVGWWSDVYSFDMSDLKPLVTKDAQVQVMNPEDIASDRYKIHDMDLKACTDSDLDFEVPFELTITRPEASSAARGENGDGVVINAFVVSFDTSFAAPPLKEPAVVLSTGVQAEPTHWKQSALWLDETNVFTASEGQVVSGTIHFMRSKTNRRDYHLKMTWTDDAQVSSMTQKQQIFKLES